MSNDIPASKLDAEQERDGRLRALAALENLRKQKNEEILQARSQGEAHVAHAFLDVVDDFERALSAMQTITGRGTKKKILDGLQLVFDKLGYVLEKLEIEGFEAEGKRFQAELMEAIAQTPTRALPPGTVSGQVRKGYRRRGQLLRPAQVVVSTEPEENVG